VVNQYLPKLVKLLEDDNTVGAQPAANSALCYAARVGSIPMMDTLIQKGAGEALLQVFIQPTYVPKTTVLHIW